MQKPAPLVAIAGVQIYRQPFQWRRPFRRRFYVLTYQGRREGYAHRWENFLAFHHTPDAAIAHLNATVAPLHISVSA